MFENAYNAHPLSYHGPFGQTYPYTDFQWASPRTAPAPWGAGNDWPKGRSLSTEGAGRRPEAGRGGGYRFLRLVETGEGGCSPLPVSPSPKGDTPTVQFMGLCHIGSSV